MKEDSPEFNGKRIEIQIISKYDYPEEAKKYLERAAIQIKDINPLVSLSQRKLEPDEE